MSVVEGEDRRMNLIVRPDTTAELDDRAPEVVVLACLGKTGVATINLHVGDKHLVGRAHTLAANTDDINALARLLVVELTGHHFVFSGPVVLTDLDAGTAHLLLELTKDT